MLNQYELLIIVAIYEDFKCLAVTAKNDEFKDVFHSSSSPFVESRASAKKLNT